MNYLENEFFLLAVTFGLFFFAKLLQKKTGIMLLNPILLTIALLILFLKITYQIFTLCSVQRAVKEERIYIQFVTQN